MFKILRSTFKGSPHFSKLVTTLDKKLDYKNI